MTATTVPATPSPSPSPGTAPAEVRPAFAPIPFTRLLRVELRKTFDTRSGFWLLMSIGILALLASAAVVAFAPDEELTYETFASAIGIPMAVLLPVVAILAITSEWSQRTGLTTFTFVPRRGRIIGAKLVVSLAIGAASMLLAAAIGAVGNVVGTAIAGVDTVWNVSASELAQIVLANELGLLVGFMLGVLLRSSPAAIVGYFVYNFVLTGLTELLAASQDWFADLRPWVDFNYAQGPLFEGAVTGADWAHLAVTAFFWLVVPLAIGLRVVMRSEVK